MASFNIRVIVLLLVLVGVQAAPLDPETHPAPGSFFSVGQHRLHLYCSGQSSSPTVILDSGLGGTSLDWAKVQPEVARYTRVCSYDRAGYGWSERGQPPRTTHTLVAELHRLLKAAELKPPYVLVGHSMSGFTMRVFASRYPSKTAGLVLIDSSHEDQFKRLDNMQLSRNIVPNNRRFLIANHFAIPDGLPAELRTTAQALALGPDSVNALYEELGAIRLSAHQAWQARALPAKPLVVLAHDPQARAKTSQAKRKANMWLELQAELAGRSPRGRLLIARQSGHYIHLDQPALVVEAIRTVVLSNRTGCYSPPHRRCL